MYHNAGIALRKDDIEMMKSLVREDDKIDILETACLQYLSKIRQRPLTSAESLNHQQLMVSTVSLEHLNQAWIAERGGAENSPNRGFHI